MTQENKHTPVPWKVYYAKNNGKMVLGTGEENGCAIQAHNGSFWRDDDEAKANAEFVVKACNSHYDLFEACTNALHNVRQVKSEEDDGNDAFLACIEYQLSEALKKARGEL